MSTSTTLEDRVLGLIRSSRAMALAGATVLTLVYLSVLFHVVDVVGGIGGVTVFGLEVLAAITLAYALSRSLAISGAVLLGGALLFGGLFGYLLMVPGASLAVGRQVGDTIALLTGLSVLRMTKAGIWALGFTPGPLFVSWYFVFRRRYALGTLVGGATLAFFMSTGDLDTVMGLVGALGAVAVLGFGDLDARPQAPPDARPSPADGADAQRSETALGWQISRRGLLIAIVTTSFSFVPGGQARPLLPNSGASTIEANLLNADNQIDVLGSIKLSPEVRFTVTAEEGTFWRVGAFDRYTGNGWVRTGGEQRYTGSLPNPPGDELLRVRQTYGVESSTQVMPAAWKPVRVGVGADRTMVTDMGGLKPVGTLSEGDQYSVESIRANPSEADLRGAGSNYFDVIEERYLQLPETTPDRVRQFTDNLTANADTAFDKARVIEQWLERNKDYSLNVNRPDGDITAAFLFRMDRGYCTYFATAMVTMLRTQGIPARFVVGYTPGQQVTDNRWVVRGLDSHAWVEVYFPTYGWIRFDPTPSGPRQAAENARIEQARVNDEPNVDTNLSQETTIDPADQTGTPTLTGVTPNTSEQREPNVSPVPEFEPGFGEEQAAADSGGSPLSILTVPSREEALYGLLLFAGAAAAAHQTGVLDRGYREVWLRRQPTGTPREQVEGAYARVEYLLGRRHRPRRPSETPREYFDAIRNRSTLRALGNVQLDDRIVELFELYERFHYRGRATAAEAERARELITSLVEERSLR